MKKNFKKLLLFLGGAVVVLFVLCCFVYKNRLDSVSSNDTVKEVIYISNFHNK